MKKVVLVGQFSDISGYGNAVRSYLKSLLVLHQNKEIDLKLINFSYENTKSDEFINFQEDVKKLFIFEGDNKFEEFDDLISQNYEVILFLPAHTLRYGEGYKENFIKVSISINVFFI